jgi:hypothetical protein
MIINTIFATEKTSKAFRVEKWKMKITTVEI